MHHLILTQMNMNYKKNKPGAVVALWLLFICNVQAMETQIIHAGDTVESIMENCPHDMSWREGKHIVKKKAMGCTIRYHDKFENKMIYYIYAHKGHWTYDHEIEHTKNWNFHSPRSLL